MDILSKFKQKVRDFFTQKSKVSALNRRHWLIKMMAGTGVTALGLSQSVHAHKVEPIDGEVKEERFPGDPAEHFLAYILNHADNEYHTHVLGSAGVMIVKYEDNVDQVVVCFGKGIHVLAKKPLRPVSQAVKDKVKSLAGQGVKFHACGRTMQSLEWSKEDMLSFVEVVEFGAADIMELQEQNYALMVW